ncbi:hypothetical protein [Mucilaginibacter segetis]|uniref:Uncharacterized protein n=1 Tax=Mucilaginibacter segetis TaxID=2793071 RepID=A0A934PSJ3_9SPHI|nr:hypothetical protein [Mucilaginibacter segetis]MBK0378416.1 hypothetical protein [Mucilaginibacter segetis]
MKVTAVVVGYLIFVLSAVALFRFTGQKPHAPASVGFQVVTAVYGIFFSVLSGFVLQLIARSGTIGLNVVLAMVIAVFAAFSMFKSDGSTWTQWQAIVLFAPSSVLGGYVYLNRKKKS